MPQNYKSPSDVDVSLDGEGGRLLHVDLGCGLGHPESPRPGYVHIQRPRAKVWELLLNVVSCSVSERLMCVISLVLYMSYFLATFPWPFLSSPIRYQEEIHLGNGSFSSSKNKFHRITHCLWNSRLPA